MTALGDDGAAEFDDLFTASRDGIVRQMLLLTGDLTEAEDVVQEAFERAWLRWSTVRHCDSPEAWVRTVARRLAVSRWRRMRNSAVAWSQRGTAESAPAVNADHLALINALQTLPQAQRVVIVLHHLADLPIAQVAAARQHRRPVPQLGW